VSTDEEPAWLTEEPSAGERNRLPRFGEVGVIDDAAAAVAVSRVSPGRKRPRWLVPVTAAVVLVLTASIVGVWALSSALTGSTNDAARSGYAYMSARMTVAAELRLDLPAGQKEQLGTFLSRFPGFRDAGSVETRLVQILDDFVRSASEGKATYVEDVQSFFSGWVVGGMAMRTGMVVPSAPLVVLGVSDRDAAEKAMLKLRSSTLAWTSQDVDGVTVWSGRWAVNDLDPGVNIDFGGQAYAVTDDALLYGSTRNDVVAALDTRAGNAKSLLDMDRFAAALARVPVGRMGLVWVDIEATRLGAMTGASAVMGGPACAALMSSYPTDAIAALYLHDGRATVDISYSRPAGSAALPVRASVLDVHVPGDTFFYLESKAAEPGAAGKALDCLRNTPGIKDTIAGIERSVGNLDDLLGWIGDTGIVARFDGSTITGGLVIDVADELKASEALGQLRVALTALGNAAGSVTVREETYRDARLVILAFDGPALSNLPAMMPSPTLAYAMKDGVLTIGVDDSFVRAVLDTQVSTSLAETAGYRRALGFAGATQNAGALYVDVPAALRLVDAYASLSGGAGGLGTMREYLEPLDDASVVVTGNDNVMTLRITLNTRVLP